MLARLGTQYRACTDIKRVSCSPELKETQNNEEMPVANPKEENICSRKSEKKKKRKNNGKRNICTELNH